jgi:cytochrome c553
MAQTGDTEVQGRVQLRALLILSTLAALWPAALHAQTRVAVDLTGEMKAVLDLQGDPARGKAAFDDCAGCHRKDASGRTNGATPRLSGQHASVIIKQIVDIRSGRRINESMKSHVEDPALSLQAFADIASYLQAMPISGNLGKGPGTGVARGKDLYARDCAACHGENGEGRGEMFHPMVAAQHYGYLLRELGLIRDGRRGNSNPGMVDLVKTYSQPDLQAVADYMAQLPAPSRR